MSVMYLWTQCDPAVLSALSLPVLAGDIPQSTAPSREPLAKRTDPSSYPLCTQGGWGEVWPDRLSVHFPEGEVVWTTLNINVICISCDLSE